MGSEMCIRDSREFRGDHYLCDHHDHHHESLRLHHAFAILSAVVVASPFLVLEYFTSFASHLTVTAALFAYSYYWVLEFLHAGYHKALGSQYAMMKHLKMFQYVAKHHEDHHRKLGTNFNLVVVLADYIFGTKAGASKGEICVIRSLSALAVVGFAVSYTLLDH